MAYKRAHYVLLMNRRMINSSSFHLRRYSPDANQQPAFNVNWLIDVRPQWKIFATNITNTYLYKYLYLSNFFLIYFLLLSQTSFTPPFVFFFLNFFSLSRSTYIHFLFLQIFKYLVFYFHFSSWFFFSHSQSCCCSFFSFLSHFDRRCSALLSLIDDKLILTYLNPPKISKPANKSIRKNRNTKNKKIKSV